MDKASRLRTKLGGEVSQGAAHIHKLMEIDELSAMLGVAKNTLYDWCAVRKIPHIKLGKFLRFDKAEIEVWLQAKRVITRDTQTFTYDKDHVIISNA